MKWGMLTDSNADQVFSTPWIRYRNNQHRLMVQRATFFRKAIWATISSEIAKWFSLRWSCGKSGAKKNKWNFKNKITKPHEIKVLEIIYVLLLAAASLPDDSIRDGALDL